VNHTLLEEMILFRTRNEPASCMELQNGSI